MEVEEETDPYLRKLEVSMEEEAEALLHSYSIYEYNHNDWLEEWGICKY